MSEIRALTYSDLPRVVAIERRTFPTPWSLSMFVLELSKPDCVCLGSVRPGPPAQRDEIDGYLICARYDEAYHLMNIAVDPDQRRHGIGRALIDAMLAQTGQDANITLEVRVSNAPAIALYEAYGFRSVGMRPRYYADTGEDALIMWRAIGTPWEAA
ncbi:MAG: ribosomal protein S18-alanine N-acetyltransferase [Solirubrobacterales bacterium]|nr:ribosomal protein S18-alanine N-acetyltransferase [Solirubrobacterales bacterium]